jgi:RNA polymerase sigma factor (sigma-70 family)
MAQGGSWPAEEVARDIHARLCQDDPVASSDLAMAYLDPLAAWLLRTNPRIDPHFCGQAAEDAILSLIKNPQSFKPEKGSLEAYLKMSARGDLRNALEKEARHRDRRADFAVVELFGSDRNLVVEDADPALIVEREEDERGVVMRTVASQAERSFTPEEQRVLELLAEGERSTAAYAQVLGIADLPESDQRREVKRVKDRLKRRLQRARGTT